ncbi:MAG: NAD-dependent epimerase/dehydratase family protein [Candidatus Aenigmarchaeota archaeon]|nr:NAD-dependent epimerase/dehydratase family protein [Candidatus Aenigmarchaeota archaeon]
MILITGADGSLGSYVSKLFSGKGVKTRLMSRAGMQKLRNSEVVLADVLDPDSLTKACDGIKTVVHLAATLDFRKPGREIMRINYEGTKNVLEAAIAAGATKFVYASSVAVYGFDPRLPVKESFGRKAKDAYGLSKIKSEDAIEKSGIGYTSLRPTVIYGRGFEAGFGKIISLVKSGRMKVVGDGQNRLHFVHASDCAQAFYLATTKKPLNTAFNIGGPEIITQENALALVARCLGVDPPTGHIDKRIALWASRLSYLAKKLGGKGAQPFDRYIKVISSDRYYDISRAKEVLGYRPAVGYEKGIGEVVGFLSSGRLL